MFHVFFAAESPALLPLRALASFSEEPSDSLLQPATLSLSFVTGVQVVYQLGASIRTFDNFGLFGVRRIRDVGSCLGTDFAEFQN